MTIDPERQTSSLLRRRNLQYGGEGHRVWSVEVTYPKP
jgi:hypothetical protein